MSLLDTFKKRVNEIKQAAKKQGVLPSQLKASSKSIVENLVKAPDTFRPKTGVIARKGAGAYQRFGSKELSPNQQYAADIGIGTGSGFVKGLGAFGGAEMLADKAFGKNNLLRTFEPVSKAGKVGSVLGNIAGYAVGPSRIVSPIGKAASSKLLGAKVATSLKGRAALSLGKTAIEEAVESGLLTPVQVAAFGSNPFKAFFSDFAAGMAGRGLFEGTPKGIKKAFGKVLPASVKDGADKYLRDSFGRFTASKTGDVVKDIKRVAPRLVPDPENPNRLINIDLPDVQFKGGDNVEYIQSATNPDKYIKVIVDSGNIAGIESGYKRTKSGVMEKVKGLFESLKDESGAVKIGDGFDLGSGKSYDYESNKSMMQVLSDVLSDPKETFTIKNLSDYQKSLDDAKADGFEDLGQWLKSKGYSFIDNKLDKKFVDLSNIDNVKDATKRLTSKTQNTGGDLLLNINKQKADSGSKSILDEIKSDFELGRKNKKIKLKAEKGSLSQNMRTRYIDKLTPINDLVKKAPKELPTEKNPYRRMRLLAGVSGQVEAYVNQNIKPALNKVKNNLDDLSAYLVMNREQELIGNGLTRKRNLEQIAQGMSELKTKLGEQKFGELQEAAQDIYKTTDDLLERLKASGIISEESYQGIKKRNERYVPFEIVDYLYDGLTKNKFTSASYNVAKQDVIKAIKSTDKGVADPIESLLTKTSKIIALTEKNNAMKTLVDLENQDKAFKDIFKKVKEAKGKSVISVFENGKKQLYEVPEVIESVVKNLDAETSNSITKFLSLQAKFLRAGATGLNVGFIPANIIRDFQDASTTELSEKGVKSMFKFWMQYPRAIYTSATQGDLYNEWLKSGGAQSTLTEQIFKNTSKSVDDLVGKRGMVERVLKSPKDLIEFANRVGEQSTRIARFKKGLDAGEDALTAAFKSRDISLDFAKSGNDIKITNQVIPFLNAGIQGTEKILRMYKENPAKATIYTTMLYGFPALMLYNHNEQFEDYKDIPQSEKDVYWIIIGRDRTPEEIEAGEKVKGVKIPKGFLGRPLSRITESGLEFFKQKDPEGLKSFLADTFESMSPLGLPRDRESLGKTLSTILPPGVQAAAEGVANKNFFFGNDIVPRKLQDVEPSEQYRESTSAGAKWLGKIFNVSPLKIENAISTTTGGLGRQALALTDLDLEEATIGQITRRFSGIRSGRGREKIFDQVSQIKTDSATNRVKLQRQAGEELEKIKKMKADQAGEYIKGLDADLSNEVVETLKDELKGLDSLDRYIKSLPVSDGSRGKAIVLILKETPKEERKAKLIELNKKGILTKSVIKQLLESGG